MTRVPTLKERADAALHETAQIRHGHWKGDPKFRRFGETVLDRYEALARAAAEAGRPVAEPDRLDSDTVTHG